MRNRSEGTRGKSLIPMAVLAIGLIGLAGTLGLGSREVTVLTVATASAIGWSVARRVRPDHG